MQKAIKVLIAVVSVLLITVVAACVILNVEYNNAEVIPPVIEAPAINGNELAFMGGTWTEYVCFDLKQKSVSTAADSAAAPLEFTNKDALTLTAPQGYDVSYIITSGGEKLQSGSDASITLSEKGDYDIVVTLIKNKNEKQGYGSFSYGAHITVTAEPEISFSGTEFTQGQVLTIVVRNMEETPTISTGLKSEPFVKTGDEWRTYIGFTYNHETGTYPVTVTCGDLTQTENIVLTDGTFTNQYMEMSSETTASSYGVAGAAQQWRDKIWPLYETSDDEIYWNGQFIWPVDGRQINTEYGLFRYVNGVYSERHPGLDIDADTGDDVYAPANGHVVLAEFLYYTGNTIVIEHGDGLKSFLYHMDSINVSEGDMVEQGQVIGHVGSTGYSTGAHMHYEVRIANQSVSPVDILDGTSGIYFE